MKTIIELFEASVSTYAENIYLYEKGMHEYKGTTYLETKELVYKMAAGLLTLGVEPGDRVAILSEGRNAWIIGELAILYVGACSVPLSVRLDATTELKFRLLHSGASMIMVSAQQSYKIEEIRAELPDIETIIYFDDKPVDREKDYTYQQIIALGAEFLKANMAVLDKRKSLVKADTLANISYTSGTTADPKGIMLTHLNYTTNVKQALTLMDIPPTHRTLAILPWDHSFAHTACLYCFMAKGAAVGSVQTGKTNMETLKNVPLNIRELKPHLLMSVPALSKNFRKSIETQISKKGKFAVAFFNHALSVAYCYNGIGFDKGRGWRLMLKPLILFYDRILFLKIRKAFGGEMEFFIGGGALLDVELQRFFYAIGIPVCQGYGLSEAAPIISSNSLKNIKMGTSGRVVDFLELKICDTEGNQLPATATGEIVIRGENVMKGYWNNPNASAEVLKAGWLHTGDLGYMDNDGFLTVLGRYKSLLIGNDGEKYSPEGIEEAITEQSVFISQCMLYNNQQPFTVGLIVPSISAINSQIEHNGLKPGSPEGIDAALALIQHDIDAYYKHGKHTGLFPERWLPSAICVLPEAFTDQNHFMNFSMKMVRGKITEAYKETLDFLLTPAAKNILNETNRRNLMKWYEK